MGKSSRRIPAFSKSLKLCTQWQCKSIHNKERGPEPTLFIRSPFHSDSPSTAPTPQPMNSSIVGLRKKGTPAPGPSATRQEPEGSHRLKRARVPAATMCSRVWGLWSSLGFQPHKRVVVSPPTVLLPPPSVVFASRVQHRPHVNSLVRGGTFCSQGLASGCPLVYLDPLSRAGPHT